MDIEYIKEEFYRNKSSILSLKTLEEKIEKSKSILRYILVDNCDMLNEADFGLSDSDIFNLICQALDSYKNSNVKYSCTDKDVKSVLNVLYKYI